MRLFRIFAIMVLIFSTVVAEIGPSRDTTAGKFRINPGGNTDQDTLLFYETFENGLNGWTTDDLTIQTNHWHPDLFNAYQGNSWWCGDSSAGGSGIMGYDNFWLQYMDSPILNLSGATSPQLTFQVYWSIEDPTTVPPPPPYDGWDGANVWISTNGGASFTPINPLTPAYSCASLSSFGTVWGMGSGIPGWANQSNGWLAAQFDLSGYTVNSVVIRFAFCSDRAVSSASGHPELLSYFVDNVVVQDGATVYLSNNADDPPIPGSFVFFQGPPFGDWWEMTTATSYSPTHCMVVDDDHFYINNALVSPLMPLPEGYTLWFEYAVLCDLPDSTHSGSNTLRDYYFVDISDDEGLTWEQQFYDYARGYCYPRWGICAPDTPYVGNTTMDLSSWAGDSILIRFRCVTDGDHTAGNGSGLHIDDVWVWGNNLMADDCGAANLHIPFPTSVNLQIIGEVELHNYGLNNQNAVPAFFRAGDSFIPLAPWQAIPALTFVDVSFNWTPTAMGEVEPYVYTSLAGDMNPNNDSCFAGTVEVLAEGDYELGYDNREAVYAYSFDQGEGPLVKFEPPFTTSLWFTLSDVKAQFNGDLINAVNITVHIFDEGTATTPGPEVNTRTFTIDPSMTYPNWWIGDMGYSPGSSNFEGDFWVWIEITNGQGYPHPVGHLRKWGEGHYFNYDGTNATEYDDDLLIRAFVTEGGIGVGEEPEMTPLKFALNQNIPNPFNSSTRIAFELPEAGQTSLKVFDLQGRLVSTIFEGKLSSGAHNYQFEGANLASGIYFYILKTEEGQLVRKLVLMK